MISLTAEAAAQVQAALRARGLEGFGLKVQIVGGGCEGFLYDLLYVDAPEPEDAVCQSRGVPVYVDARALPAVDGMVIDHRRTRYGEGFTFENPRAASRCSCGASFAV
ncbi:MAG TPA: iron-sulfur cluster assembly accessory protein [Myxococcales bacterium]|jgi:iron-sulfur cluster assembly accessory protein|nr:iron-sulfur cluster assembly accessory protein [Myxococcales bacterium]